MLSMVATRRRADSRSGAREPRARQAPLNSSISAIRRSISWVICNEAVGNIPIYTPIYTQLGTCPLDSNGFDTRDRNCKNRLDLYL